MAGYSNNEQMAFARELSQQIKSGELRSTLERSRSGSRGRTGTCGNTGNRVVSAARSNPRLHSPASATRGARSQDPVRRSAVRGLSQLTHAFWGNAGLGSGTGSTSGVTLPADAMDWLNAKASIRSQSLPDKPKQQAQPQLSDTALQPRPVESSASMQHVSSPVPQIVVEGDDPWDRVLSAAANHAPHSSLAGVSSFSAGCSNNHTEEGSPTGPQSNGYATTIESMFLGAVKGELPSHLAARMAQITTGITELDEGQDQPDTGCDNDTSIPASANRDDGDVEMAGAPPHGPLDISAPLPALEGHPAGDEEGRCLCQRGGGKQVMGLAGSRWAAPSDRINRPFTLNIGVFDHDNEHCPYFRRAIRAAALPEAEAQQHAVETGAYSASGAGSVSGPSFTPRTPGSSFLAPNGRFQTARPPPATEAEVGNRSSKRNKGLSGSMWAD